MRWRLLFVIFNIFVDWVILHYGLAFRHLDLSRWVASEWEFGRQWRLSKYPRLGIAIYIVRSIMSISCSSIRYPVLNYYDLTILLYAILQLWLFSPRYGPDLSHYTSFIETSNTSPNRMALTLALDGTLSDKKLTPQNGQDLMLQ